VHLKIPQQAQKFSERESAVRKVIPLLAALSLVGAIAQQPAQSQSIVPAADGTGTLSPPTVTVSTSAVVICLEMVQISSIASLSLVSTQTR
jgi:hypothetical protein